MKFPIFWFEGNLWFNYVKSFEDLENVLKAYKGTETVDDFFDKAKNATHTEKPYYGFRRECDGEKTLRQFLIENGINMPKCEDTSIGDYIKSIRNL